VNLFDLLGWKADFSCAIPNKCVVCIAPHTSNWDFIIGIIFKSAYKIQANFFIKKEWLQFPTKTLIAKLGGLPINRSQQQSTTDTVAAEFDKREKLLIGITPEGTRKRNEIWKMGFYYIALKANVPILPLSLNYKNKIVKVGKPLLPTGNIKKDIAEIADFYKNVTAKIPRNFALPQNFVN
jgi:1-acyl-sn-glycerol-3-phosphate acyltransferase